MRKRSQSAWVCDECTCGHTRLHHLNPKGAGGCSDGKEECRHSECVTMDEGAVGTKCRGFIVWKICKVDDYD